MILRIFIGILVLLLVLLVVGLVRSRLNEPDRVVDAEPWSEKTRFVETRSGRVHVYDQGTGTPILFFHGSGRSLADVQEALGPLLAEDYRVIAIDHYGFGLSDRGHGWRYGLGHWADQGRDVLDALGIEGPVFIAGHSSGSATATIFAARYPDRASGVILMSHGIAIAPPQIPMLLPGVGELVFSGPMPFVPDYSPVHRERMAQAYRIRGTRHAMMTFVRRQYTVDGIELMNGAHAGIEVPVLQIHGTEDEEIPLWAAQVVQDKLQDGRLHIIEGSRHDLHILYPEEVARVISEFVAVIQSQ